MLSRIKSTAILAVFALAFVSTAVLAQGLSGSSGLSGGWTFPTGIAPTAAGSGGTCATGAIAGNANAGTVTLTGACAATNTVTLTFAITALTGWSCFATDRTAAASLFQQSSSTTTTAVLKVAGTTSGTTDVISYICVSY